MAIQTVYYRQKIAGAGWRYRPLAVGLRPEAARNGPYFIRVRNSAGKYQWVKHDTEQAAAKAAKVAPVARQAQELGLTVDDLTNEANANRISIKAAVENCGFPASLGDQIAQLLKQLSYFDARSRSEIKRGIRQLDQPRVHT